jgi:hypothetical protein
MGVLWLSVAVAAFFFFTVIGCAIGLAKLGQEEDV